MSRIQLKKTFFKKGRLMNNIFKKANSAEKKVLAESYAAEGDDGNDDHDDDGDCPVVSTQIKGSLKDLSVEEALPRGSPTGSMSAHSDDPLTPASDELPAGLSEGPPPTVELSGSSAGKSALIDPTKQRFPFCVVWTPIPLLTWLMPFIGHIGIATSDGVIMDFGGPYFVSVDKMSFGKPTRYLVLNPKKVDGGEGKWDEAVLEASEEYRHRMHNLFCDNCHSHVALALNLMNYSSNSNWNMVKLAAWMFVYGRYVGLYGFLKTWAPSLLILVVFGLLIGVPLYTK